MSLDERAAWQQTRALFERLHQMAPPERAECLANVVDPTVAAELRALLEADAMADSELDRPAGELHLDHLRRQADDPLVGTELDGYRLEQVIGEGGTSTVFLGRRAGGADVAVKVLKAELASSELVARFRHERELLAGLRHPGLITIVAAGETEDGRPYLVTEHIAGQPIDVYCRERRLDRSSILALFREVCHAVHHAHRHLVVHRDLKPGNILVDAHGQPRVLDFGIAKLLEPSRDPGWTATAQRAPMTPSFASPEQVRGGPVSTASDIYSLGVLLYHLLLGHSPYRPSASDRAELERAVLEDPPRSPRELGLTPLPRDLAMLLATTMRKLPGERYPSAEHLADDVGRYLEHRPLRARRRPLLSTLLGAARRRPLVTGVVSGVTCLLFGSWLATAMALSKVRASESIAWRAHASAVMAVELLGDVLERVGATGAPEQLAEPMRVAESHLQQLGEAPEAEARLRLALARVQLRLGAMPSARIHLERALALARSTQGLTWQDADRCLELLIELAIAEGDEVAPSLAAERLRLRAEHDADLVPAELQMIRARSEAVRPNR